MWAVGWAIHRQGGAGIQVSKANHRARKPAHIRPQDAQVFMARGFGVACRLGGCPTRQFSHPSRSGGRRGVWRCCTRSRRLDDMDHRQVQILQQPHACANPLCRQDRRARSPTPGSWPLEASRRHPGWTKSRLALGGSRRARRRMQACRRAARAAIAHLQEARGPSGWSAMRLHRGAARSQSFWTSEKLSARQKAMASRASGQVDSQASSHTSGNRMSFRNPRGVSTHGVCAAEAHGRPTTVPSRPRKPSKVGAVHMLSKISRGQQPTRCWRLQVLHHGIEFLQPGLARL